MKILLAHNHYIQRGGEDTAYHAEKEILQSRGHRIIEYKDHNARIREMGRIQLGLNTLFSVSSRTRLRKTLAQHRIELAHFQNIFPLISPSAYYACQDMSTPVVQTLHNFRLICPSAMLFRSGVPCESCVGRVVAWNGVLHRCYRGSTMQTAAVALMQSLHKLLDTWNSKVDIYVALTIFGKSKFVAGGLDAGKIVVKPNCIQSDPGSRPDGGRYALFVGRLSREKGLGTLLEAARKAPSVPLKIIGIGSLFNDLASAVQESRLNNIELCGFLCQNEILSFMKGARFLIFPSEWYEGFPLTLVESFACGLPVVASRLGAIPEIVEDGRTGLLFRPGDSTDLAHKIEWAWIHEKQMTDMGKNARREYELKYTAERNYEMLMHIYDLAKQRGRERYGSRYGAPAR